MSTYGFPTILSLNASITNITEARANGTRKYLADPIEDFSAVVSSTLDCRVVIVESDVSTSVGSVTGFKPRRNLTEFSLQKSV